MNAIPSRNGRVDIVALCGANAERNELSTLRQVLVDCEDLYPGIDLWLDRTAIPGICDGSRVGLLAYCDGKVAGASLVKAGGERKLCSLRVLPSERGHHIGTALFLRAAELLSSAGPQFHFTAPEALSVERRGFFESIGFRFEGRLSVRYRRDGDEHLFVGDPLKVAAATRYRLTSTLFETAEYRATVTLMSIRPPFAAGILRGNKSIEVRKRFDPARVGSILVLYATSPIQQVVGWARVSAVHSMRAKDVWEGFGPLLGCTEADLAAYARPDERVAAIELVDVHAFESPPSLSSLRATIGEQIQPPQAFVDLGGEDGWTRALSKVGILDRVG